MLFTTVAGIEVIWTLIALAGIGFGVYNLRDALGDRRAIRIMGVANGRKIIADYAVRQELARITIQTIFAITGILVMLLPNPPVDPLDSVRAWVTFIVRWGFVTSGILLLIQSIDSYNTRHKLLGD